MGELTSLDWLNAGSSVLGSALKPSSGGPSSADSIFGTNLAFDNSGWNVSLGDNSGIRADVDKTNEQGGTSGSPSGIQDYLPYFMLLLGAVVAIKMFKASK